MKPGIKTTEFWLCLVLVVLNGMVASELLPASHWAVQVAAAVISGAAVLGYTVARAKVKVQNVLSPPAQPPE